MKTEHAYTYAGLAEAFAIFFQYDNGFAQVACEHDIIYAGPDPDVVSENHKKTFRGIALVGKQRVFLP